MNNIFEYVEEDGKIIITGLQEGVTTTSIVVPETINNMPVIVIAYQAFKESSITSIKIGGNIRAIDAGAFEDCKSLTSVIWNDHCKTIPNRCFSRCVSLSTFDLSGVESIGKWAFEGSGLQKVDLPRNIQEVGDSAFSDCRALKAVHWTAQNKNIPQRCFANCASLSIFDFSSVESIDDGAFAESGLQEVNLPHNIQEVGELVFRECKSLKTFLSIAFTIVCLFQCSIFQVLKAFTKGRLQKVDFRRQICFTIYRKWNHLLFKIANR